VITACSNHCAERWRDRIGPAWMSLPEAKRAVLAAVAASREATPEEVAMIRASSKGAAFRCHPSTEYRILGQTVFVVGPGRHEPGVRVVVTVYDASYVGEGRRAA